MGARDRLGGTLVGFSQPGFATNFSWWLRRQLRYRHREDRGLWTIRALPEVSLGAHPL
jgi:hypothetical protein